MSLARRAGARSTAWVISVVLVAASCGGGAGHPSITEARIGQPAGPNAALYFTVAGYGDEDTLLSASTSVASVAEIHETITGEEGTISMQWVASLELPANGQLILEPGGYHIMLVDVEQLEIGATVAVVLTWQKASDQTIEAEVIAPADTVVHGDGLGGAS